MPQVYVKDDIYHRIVRLGKTGSRDEVLGFVEDAIEEKLQKLQKEE